MDIGAHPTEDLELPLLQRRVDVIRRLRALRARFREDREQLLEAAEEAKALGLHNAARPEDLFA